MSYRKVFRLILKIMMKYFLSTLLLTCMFGISYSQTEKPKMDHLKKDPKTIGNAAKADASLIDRKNIFDSTSKIQAINKKRVSCKFKRKQTAISTPK